MTNGAMSHRLFFLLGFTCIRKKSSTSSISFPVSALLSVCHDTHSLAFSLSPSLYKRERGREKRTGAESEEKERERGRERESVCVCVCQREREREREREKEKEKERERESVCVCE